MAIGVLFEIQGTQAQYDQVIRRLEAQGLAAPEGRRYHVAGPTERGWRVVDVWDSPETFGRFGERLMPILRDVGIPPVEPQVWPSHNIIVG